MLRRLLTILVFMFSVFVACAQLEVNHSFSPYYLVNNYIKGYGITVSNVKFQGDSLARGYFRANNTDLGISEGVILSTGSIYNAIGPNGYENRTTKFETASIPELDSLAGVATCDAAVLEFDFIPIGDSIFISYIFASEEYNEWVGYAFSDAFGVFISGGDIDGYVNIAKILDTDMPINISNINKNSQYKNLYRNNYGGAFIEYDGMTVKLKASMKVKPYVMYHCKIAIADANDNTYDSGVFIEKGSFCSNNLCGSITAEIDLHVLDKDSLIYNVVEGCRDIAIKLKLDRVPDSTITINCDIAGTATNGVDYEWIDHFVTFEKGVDSAVIVFSPKKDDIAEGTEIVILNLPVSLCDAYSPHTFVIYDFIPFEKDTFSNDIVVCYGNHIDLKGKYKGGIEPYTYKWSDKSFVGDSINIKPSVGATYTLTVVEACGASIIDQMHVTVRENPKADFDFDITRYRVNFDNLSTGGTKYVWDFGDGDTSQQKNVIYVYEDAGLFAVKLAVENDYGCRDSIIKVVDLLSSGVEEVVDHNVYEKIVIRVKESEIYVRNLTNVSDIALELYNVQGNLLYSKNISKGDNFIRLNQFSKGMYVLVVKDLNGKAVYLKKIVY